MTAALFDTIHDLPEVDESPEKPVFTDGVILEEEEKPKRTRQPRKPRTPRIDPETGEPVKVTRAPRSAKLAEDLLETTISAASDISPIAPTVAGVLVTRAETLVDGMVELARGRKRTTAVLRKVASTGKIAELLSIAAMLFVAAMVDFGKIPLESPILDNVGFSEIMRDEHNKPQRNEQGLVVKSKMTIRDIHNTMVPRDREPQSPMTPTMPQWNPMSTMPPDTGSGPITVPPMNWNSAVPGMPR